MACHQRSLNTIKHHSQLPSYLRYALLVVTYISIVPYMVTSV